MECQSWPSDSDCRKWCGCREQPWCMLTETDVLQDRSLMDVGQDDDHAHSQRMSPMFECTSSEMSSQRWRRCQLTSMKRSICSPVQVIIRSSKCATSWNRGNFLYARAHDNTSYFLLKHASLKGDPIMFGSHRHRRRSVLRDSPSVTTREKNGVHRSRFSYFWAWNILFQSSFLLQFHMSWLVVPASWLDHSS